MPWSILSEVTATIVGSVISSIIYIKFDFVETLLVPGMALNEEAVWRNFLTHAVVPLLTLGLGLLHMLLLHQNKYGAAGGFKRLFWAPRFRETRRWGYLNRY
jgi:quinol-cytochrome oxidoreductase complex cytochrome b subunit